MALEDIVRRIGDDADREAAALIDEARARADEIVSEAKRRAYDLREEIAEEALDRAARERETLLANARLAARDRALRAQMELIDRVLRAAQDSIVSLPDDRYAAWIAREVAAVARGGERLEIGVADGDRLAPRLGESISQAAEELGRGKIDVAIDGTAKDLEHGVKLVGPRMSVTISPQAFIASRREELTGRAAALLFADSGEVS